MLSDAKTYFIKKDPTNFEKCGTEYEDKKRLRLQNRDFNYEYWGDIQY